MLNKKLKRISAICLAFVLSLGVFAFPVYAADDDPYAVMPCSMTHCTEQSRIIVDSTSKVYLYDQPEKCAHGKAGYYDQYSYYTYVQKVHCTECDYVGVITWQGREYVGCKPIK